MDFDWLSVFQLPTFVAAWYVVGIVGALWVTFDTLRINTHVNEPLKAAWPVIILFFSFVGVVLYFWTCRPPGIGYQHGDEAKRLHHRYVDRTWKKVTGSVIHCVGGDGLGIMTAMVFSRLIGLTFWHEFWFEYAVGFAFGWFVFQQWAFYEMDEPPGRALWKAFRAEFFSMITVMLGMGLVMRFVTPRVVGHAPGPATAAFWGFGALGLLVGFVVTFPVNWWLVRIGWKHGMS